MRSLGMHLLLRPAVVAASLAILSCASVATSDAQAKTTPSSKASLAVDPPYFPADGVPDVALHGAAYVGTDGVLTFVSLSDGKVRWSTSTSTGWFLAALVVQGDRVHAAERAGDHAIDVATFDAKNGTILAHSKPIALPQWAPIRPVGGGASSATGRIDASGALVVHWTSSTSYWGGVAPTPEMVEASTHRAEGAARVDVASGAITILSEDDAKKEGQLQVRTAPQIGALPKQLPADAQYGGPVVVGDRIYWFSSTPMTSAATTTETRLHAFDRVQHVALWDTVVRHDVVFLPPP